MSDSEKLNQVISLLNQAKDILAAIVTPPAPGRTDGVYGGPFGWVKFEGLTSGNPAAPIDPDPYYNEDGTRRWVTPMVLANMFPAERQQYMAVDEAAIQRLLALLRDPATAEKRYHAPNFLK
jgi:hypothetical protein